MSTVVWSIDRYDAQLGSLPVLLLAGAAITQFQDSTIGPILLLTIGLCAVVLLDALFLRPPNEG